VHRTRVLSLLALLAARPAVHAQSSAIINAGVVDVRAGTARAGMTVVVRDGRIVTVGPSDSVAIPVGATRIDAQNGFLIPGLADMHAHFKRPEELEVLLAHGVTLVQYLNASPEMLDWRDSIATGRIRGPEIHACYGSISGVDSAAQAIRIVAQAAADGYGCIKIYARISNEAYMAFADEGRRRAVRTVGHIPRNLTWQQMLRARPNGIAHAEEFLYSPIESAADIDSILTGMRAGGTALIATLNNYDIITRQVVELPELLQQPGLALYSPVERRLWTPRWNHYYRDFRIEQIPDLRRRLAFQRTLVRRLDSAGVRILVGTDAGNLFVLPGPSVHDELRELVLAGLSPAAALRAATIGPAEFMGRDSVIGTIEPGKRADLVLVRGNPLRDITVTSLIGGVMRNGHWQPRDSLRARLSVIRERYAREERFLDEVERSGIATATARARTRGYLPDQRALNELAYQFWRVQKDTASARRTFEVNARLHAGNWIARGSLGEWLAGRGDWAGARREVEFALRIRPNDRDLRELLSRIERRER
jgi:hypothetical protein